MSKRIRFAKLRLTKPSNATAKTSSHGVDEGVPAPIDEGGNGSENETTSKYFSKGLAEACSSKVKVEVKETSAKLGTCGIQNSPRSSIELSEIEKTSTSSSIGLVETCSNQGTFVKVEVEETSAEPGKCGNQNSLRRSVELSEPCTTDGLKLPKLRKKTKGNPLISSFLERQPIAPDDDFEESRPVAAPKKPKTKVQRARKKTATNRRPKNQSDIRKLFSKYKNDHEVVQELLKEHSESEQIDPEQLQLALAMSRSLAESDGTSNASTDNPSEQSASDSLSSAERRIVGIRTTLEQFGFRCKNSYTDYDLNLIFGSAVCKSVKKIKHSRATNLVQRSAKDLTEYIEARVKKIFPAEMLTIENHYKACTSPSSCLSHLFWLAQTDQASVKIIERYYVPELLEMNPAPVGCMLKDWSKIPGREPTPERADSNDLESNPTEIHRKEQSERGSSPDLFEDCVEAQENVATVKTANNGAPRETLAINDDHAEEQSSIQNDPHVCNLNKSNYLEGTSHELSCKQNQVDDYSSNVDRQISILAQCAVLTIDDDSDEDDKFVTASEEPRNDEGNFHRSTDNIFEDSDPDPTVDLNPIVSFETYSSEEEKISAAAEVPAEVAFQDGYPDLVAESPSQPQQELTNISNKPKCHRSQNGLDYENIETSNSAPLAAKDSLAVEKELSFHRIAIKARLSEALEGKNNMIETVNLLEEEEAEYAPESQCSAVMQHEMQDEVLEISDDEVNYSMWRLSCTTTDEGPLQEVSQRSEEDPERTIIYQHNAPVINHDHPVKPYENILSPSANDILDESEVLSRETNGAIPENVAEDTIAYLDNLVKQFNLPPLKKQKEEIIEDSAALREHPVEISGLSEEAKENSTTHSTNDHYRTTKVTTESSLCTVAMAGRLSNFLQNYEEPLFEEHEIEAETMASQSCSKKVPIVASKNSVKRLKSFNQFDSPKEGGRLKRTVSESDGFSSSTPNEKEQLAKMHRFKERFDNLKVSSNPFQKTEYVINTVGIVEDPPNYDAMSATEIERELFKYGLKLLDREKAVKVLRHIYDEIHPFVRVVERIDSVNYPEESDRNHDQPVRANASANSNVGSLLPRICPFTLNTDEPNTILSSKPRKKMGWCTVPLHVAFFNMISENRMLQRQILRYEPVNLDHIHAALKQADLRYETNDMIAFLDKHCITFRSSASNGDRSKGKGSKAGTHSETDMAQKYMNEIQD